MSENFGARQPRVLNTLHRSLDNVVFQYRTPPLSSEWNLINQIGNEKIQELSKMSYPSGWVTVGDILQGWSESDILTGQVNCSESYPANSFKLFSKKDNVAIVNGWPIIVQGTSSPDSNNVIQVGPPAGQIYDFVFLEVWKKLIGDNGPVYPYGNVLSNPYPDNEIVWGPIGTETTKRVQLQYRIRTAGINTTLFPTDDVFNTTIYPIGGLSAPYEYPLYSFRKYGASDIGLYISGYGDDQTYGDSKAILGTVDGYVYAVPMFLVYRREESDSLFSPTQMKYSYVTRQMFNAGAGYRSDRPDGKLADVVYKDDVVDYRHKIITSGKDVESIIDQTIAKLVSGELDTALKTGFGDNGGTTTASSGGSSLTKVERVNSVSGDNIPNVGTGSNVGVSVFKRRVFCNAELTQDHNIVEIPRNGSVWAAGTINLSSVISGLPTDGKISTADGFYDPDTTYTAITGVTFNFLPQSLTISPTSNIVGTSKKVMMEFTFYYSSSAAGFKDVPKRFIEVGKGNQLPIATRDGVVPLRYNNVGELLNFEAGTMDPGYPGEVDSRDFIRYLGGNYTENYNFGLEMVVHRDTTGTPGIVTIHMPSGTYNGYYILGVKSVEIATSPGNYGTPVAFQMQRGVNGIPPYTIQYYQVNFTPGSTPNVRVVLYIGSKPLNDISDTYSVSDSIKFFELSKQGRGIVDTYEVIEVIGTEIASGDFSIDTVDKPIIALLTKAVYSSSYVGGTQPFVFRYNSAGSSVDISNIQGISDPAINSYLPALSSTAYSASLMPNKLVVTVPAAVGWGYIRVPVLVHSYVAHSDISYNFYYKTNAYQGILKEDTEFYGKIDKEGPAIVTTLGSGSISDYSYSTGGAVFLNGTRTINASVGTTEWLHYVQPGDYIRKQGSNQYYRILSVNSNTRLTIAELYVEDGSPAGNDYEIVRVDVPHDNFSNIIDRMPAYLIQAGSANDFVDYHFYSDNISSAGSTFFHGQYHTIPRQKMQDPMCTLVNDFKLGDSGTSKRGRNNFVLTTNNRNPVFKLSNPPRPQLYYDFTVILPAGRNKKVFQMYLFNMSAKGQISGESDLTGRLYLMVVSGEVKPVIEFETSLNAFYDKDTVDLFELVGRPIVKFD